MVWLQRLENWMRILCVIFGILLIAFSLTLLYAGCKSDNAIFQYGAFIKPTEFANSSRAAILMGVFLIGILMLQILGAVRQWSFFLFMNALLLGYLVILSAFLIYYAKLDNRRLDSQFQYGLFSTLKEFGDDSIRGKEIRMGWTSLQMSKACCGVKNYSDWKHVKMITHDPQVPISCCRKKVAFCSDNVKFVNSSMDAKYIYIEGCFNKVKAELSLDNLWILMIPFEVIGTISVLMSGYLAWSWRRGADNGPSNLENRPQRLIEESE